MIVEPFAKYWKQTMDKSYYQIKIKIYFKAPAV